MRTKLKKEEREAIKEWLELNIVRKTLTCPFWELSKEKRIRQMEYCEMICKEFFPELDLTSHPTLHDCPCPKFGLEIVEAKVREVLRKEEGLSV